MRIEKFIKQIINPLKSSYYVGFLSEDYLNLPIKERYSKIQWINVKEQSKTGWFADPFIYSINKDEIILFVEELIYSQGKGILSKLVVDRKSMSIKDKHTLLELPTHLSFPIYYIEGGKTYVYPENCQSGKVKIYEYKENIESLEYISDIIDEPLLDTQIAKIGETYYAFGVRYETGTMEDTKELRVFKSDSLTGKYTYMQSIFNDKAEERGAGIIFSDCENRTIRPAQSCENGYGKHIVLYQLIFENGLFRESIIQCILPDETAKYGNVFHTFNSFGSYISVDGWNYIHPTIANLYSHLLQH